MFVYLKFRLQRNLRRLRRDLRRFNVIQRQYFDRNIWGKWRQAALVRRFLIMWAGVILVAVIGLWQQTAGLNRFYQMEGGHSGGVYVEGLVGEVKAINPVLPESTSADDVSRLIFNGLTRYTPERGIEGDLAESWTVSPDGKSYVFKLRRDVKWHDGTPFTAQDVMFTLQLIQNPDTRSPYANSWQGVEINANDDYTVTYTLPNPYPPFIYSTTVGMLPVHILGPEDPALLRVSSFNQRPVGTGPFRIIRLSPMAGLVELRANPDYFRGEPKLDGFNVRFFKSESDLMSAYSKKQVTAIGRLRGQGVVDSRRLGEVKLIEMSLPDQTGLFMKTTSPLLSDKAVRQSITQAINRDELISQLAGELATEQTLPILPGQLGYTTKSLPPKHDPAAANSLLDGAGWARQGDVRVKGDQSLKLRLVTLDGGDYPAVSEAIAKQLAAVGIKVEVTRVDVSRLQQSYIRPRNYDLLLYGINIGADPDVYTFWHSSQVSDPGLNLSQYSSKDADKALESARVAVDNELRKARYGNFLTAWVNDLPAVILYNPTYVYATDPDVQGVVARKLVEPADRFYDVQLWTMRTEPVPKIKH